MDHGDWRAWAQSEGLCWARIEGWYCTRGDGWEGAILDEQVIEAKWRRTFVASMLDVETMWAGV